VPHTVNLEAHLYDCGEYGKRGIPCDHACSLILHRGLAPTDFCDSRYSVECFRRTYEARLPLISTVNLEESDQCKEPSIVKKNGRRKDSRHKGQMRKEEVGGGGAEGWGEEGYRRGQGECGPSGASTSVPS